MQQRSRRMRAGATLVETAIVISLMVTMMLAVFEFGRFVMIRQLAENAVRAGARQAAVNTQSLQTSDIQSTVIGLLVGQPVNVTSFSVYQADPATGNNLGSWQSAPFGSAIAVDLQGTYQPMLPFFHFLPGTVTLHTRSIMRSEAN